MDLPSFPSAAARPDPQPSPAAADAARPPQLEAQADVQALARVQEEVERVLDAVPRALQRLRRGAVPAEADPATVLQLSLRQLQQVAGALRIAGFTQAALLPAAAAELLGKAAAQAGPPGTAVIEGVEQGCAALHSYLRRWRAGQPLSALTLFPAWSTLQALCGAERIHPADLWPVPWHWQALPVDERLPPLQPDTATLGAAEQLTLALMREARPAAATRLSELFAALARGAADGRMATLWALASAVYEGLAKGRLKPEVHLKRVYSRLLAQLRRGPLAPADAVSQRLAHDLLYFCAQAGELAQGGATPRLAAVRRAWSLQAHPAVDVEHAPMTGPDAALLAHTQRQLATVQALWDAAAGGMPRPGLREAVAQLTQSLRQLLPRQAEAVGELTQTLQHVMAEPGAEVSGAALEVAQALLALQLMLQEPDADIDPELLQRLSERIVHALANSPVDGPHPDAPVEPWLLALAQRGAQRPALLALGLALRSALNEAGLQLDALAQAPDAATLQALGQRLQRLQGVLTVLSQPGLAQSLRQLRETLPADPAALEPGQAARLARRLAWLDLACERLALELPPIEELPPEDPADEEAAALPAPAPLTPEPLTPEPLPAEAMAPTPVAEPESEPAAEPALPLAAAAEPTPAAAFEPGFEAEFDTGLAPGFEAGPGAQEPPVLLEQPELPALTEPALSADSAEPWEEAASELPDMPDLPELVEITQPVMLHEPAIEEPHIELATLLKHRDPPGAAAALRAGDAGTDPEAPPLSGPPSRLVALARLGGAQVVPPTPPEPAQAEADFLPHAPLPSVAPQAVVAPADAASEDAALPQDAAPVPEASPETALEGEDAAVAALLEAQPWGEAGTPAGDAPAVGPRPPLLPDVAAPSEDDDLGFDLSFDLPPAPASAAPVGEAGPGADLALEAEVPSEDDGLAFELSFDLPPMPADMGSAGVSSWDEAGSGTEPVSMPPPVPAAGAAEGATPDGEAAPDTRAAEPEPEPLPPAPPLSPIAHPGLLAPLEGEHRLVGELRVPQSLFDIYIEEAEALSARLHEKLWQWRPPQPLEREPTVITHALAGMAATVGDQALSQLARVLEDTMAPCRRPDYATPEMKQRMGEGVLRMREMLTQFAAGMLPPPVELAFLHYLRAPHEVVPVPPQNPFGPPPQARKLALTEEPEPMPEGTLVSLPDLLSSLSAPPAEAAAADGEPPEDTDAEPAPAAAADEAAPEIAAEAGDEALEPALSTDFTAEAAPAAAADEAAPEAAAEAWDEVLEPASPEDFAAEPAPAAVEDEPVPEAVVEAGDEVLELPPEDAVPAPDAVAAAPVPDDLHTLDPALFPVFEDEAQELMPRLAHSLSAWAADCGAEEYAGAGMRVLHTLKGGARLAGAMRLGEAAHALESAIEDLLTRSGLPQRAEIEELLARADALAAEFERLRTAAAPRMPETVPAAPAAEAVERPAPVSGSEDAAAPSPEPAAADRADSDAPGEALSEAAVSAPEAAAVAEAAPVPAAPLPLPAPATAPQGEDAPPASALPPLLVKEAAPAPDSTAIDWSRFEVEPPPLPPAAASASPAATVRVRAPALDRLVAQAGEVGISHARLAAELQQLGASLADLDENLQRLRSQLREVELQAETQLDSRLEAARQAAQAFDPLELDRYTRLQELARMMAESLDDVSTVQHSLRQGLRGTDDELVALARLAGELQDELLRTRLVAFDSLAERLQRVLRQAAQEAQRQVRLEIEGGAVEIDRGVLERMAPAFEHLLRNAVVHGIEPPAERFMVGKPTEGRVLLRLVQEGAQVTVSCSDDGRGLDLQRIQRRAVERGLLALEAQPDAATLQRLVFAPGFSTAERLSPLAGRGVGLDVVRAEVEALGGHVGLETTPGQGSRFTLQLPLTTAVMPVLLLRCGEATVAVPAALVEEVLRVPAPEARQAAARGRFGAGSEAPVFQRLEWLLEQPLPPAEEPEGMATVLLLRGAQQRLVLQVQEVLGRQEAVLKPLGPQLATLPGLAGMSLLPSGVPLPVYNPAALALRHTAAQQAAQVGGALGWTATPAAGAAREGAAEADSARPLVLVVDDSLTVRRATRRLLEREGYRVALAKDGIEALQRLEEEAPALLLTDLEMPRLDGFELLRRLRQAPRWQALPVIVITSRLAARHRELAAALGVEHYLGKPYAQEELLTLVARYSRALQAQN